jgi:hypothetical protein
MQKPELAEKMGQAGKLRANKLFATDKIIGKYLTLYSRA